MAQGASHRSLLALSKADHVLAIIDPVTLKITARIPVGPDPHEVIAAADGRTAYVTNMGNGDSHEIDVIDLTTQKRLPDIDTRPLYSPHGIDYQGGKVWFTAQDSKAIGRYNPADNKLDWSMGTGQDWTHMIYVTADEKKIYTTNVRSGTVSIIENKLITPDPNHSRPGEKPRWQWTETVVPVSKGSEGFDVSPDGREIWTAAAEDGVISVIDTGTRRVTASIDAHVEGANRLKFTPDGRHVFITSLRSGDLYIYDAATRKELKKLNIGHGSAGILMDPDGSRAFVASTGGNSIAVVDLRTLEVTGHIDLGGPDGLAWAVAAH
jgi:YVTN family beta-propeller protein